MRRRTAERASGLSHVDVVRNAPPIDGLWRNVWPAGPTDPAFETAATMFSCPTSTPRPLAFSDYGDLHCEHPGAAL